MYLTQYLEIIKHLKNFVALSLCQKMLIQSLILQLLVQTEIWSIL